MPTDVKTITATHWEPHEYQDMDPAYAGAWVPTVLIVHIEDELDRALETAKRMFAEHLEAHGMEWDSYELSVSLNSPVAMLSLDPPVTEDEDEDDWN